MIKILTKTLAIGSITMLMISTSFLHAGEMQDRIQSSIQILDSKQASSDPIPEELIAHCKGVAIFTITKAGLGVGGQGGEGIVVLRQSSMNSHSWTAPSAFNLSGASIGAQIGFTEDHYIIILNTDDAVRHFTSSEKTNWNATASGTVGSDSETAKASTTDLEHREVIVYKETSGVFGGATLGGTSIECKSEVNRNEYGNVTLEDILSGKVQAPHSAGRMYVILDGKQ